MWTTVKYLYAIIAARHVMKLEDLGLQLRDRQITGIEGFPKDVCLAPCCTSCLCCNV